MFFRQIAQKNICSYPAFTRRTSVRMIYNLVDISLVIYLHAHARVNYHLVIFSPHMYNMHIYTYIHTYIYVYIECTSMYIDVCICRYITIDVSEAYLVSDMSS